MSCRSSEIRHCKRVYPRGSYRITGVHGSRARARARKSPPPNRLRVTSAMFSECKGLLRRIVTMLTKKTEVTSSSLYEYSVEYGVVFAAKESLMDRTATGDIQLC